MPLSLLKVNQSFKKVWDGKVKGFILASSTTAKYLATGPTLRKSQLCKPSPFPSFIKMTG